MLRLNVPHSCKNYASTFSLCFGRVNLKCYYSTQSQLAEEEHFSAQFQPIIGLEVSFEIFIFINNMCSCGLSQIPYFEDRFMRTHNCDG